MEATSCFVLADSIRTRWIGYCFAVIVAVVAVFVVNDCMAVGADYSMYYLQSEC